MVFKGILTHVLNNAIEEHPDHAVDAAGGLHGDWPVASTHGVAVSYYDCLG